MSKSCIIFFLIILISSCSQTDKKSLITYSGKAQGTYYHIKHLSNNTKSYKAQVDSILNQVDNSLSTYKKNSLISKLNLGVECATDSLFNIVFYASKKVFNESEGYFDCSIGPIVDYWGFYNNKINDSVKIDTQQVNRLISNIGFKKIELIDNSLILPKGMRLDFNSIAQGFSVDLIGNYLISMGVNDFMIELGGEILVKGENPNGELWTIGIEKPTDKIDRTEYQFIIPLRNKALATSGNYRKYYIKDGIKYSHTINPFTGFPSKNKLLSVTVIHNQCMLADAYATAFMSMGLSKTKKFLVRNPNIQVCLVYTNKDGEWETYVSKDLKKMIKS